MRPTAFLPLLQPWYECTYRFSPKQPPKMPQAEPKAWHVAPQAPAKASPGAP
ncbi:hypothetical protein BRADI_1g51467v3 [Brachypodium distachyon]|uniref:Uncharacterized protein n=1 Tax=Brachypodium distachyon TaxID=15368 RepID=A0A2K2DQW7_BRADI|nr:hypothetical protein BRADI_1g51467v3 [Brachypodium distachyon]